MTYLCHEIWITVFDLITAPALITAHPDVFYFIFTYYHPLDDLCPDFLLYFLGHKLISVAFKLAPAIAGLKFIYISLFTVANLFWN